ncbi:tetratricopeptide repeat protein [Alkalihalobacillus sp. 1P02AB]|uniref:tetratricopeptide repeat protein n=1 Tax=Alkalihalobacillus sp. 1P02AB TaxID=3132260 RepID=UPI0039A573B3
MKEIQQGLTFIEEGKIEEGLKKIKQAKETANHDQLFTIAEIYYELGHLQEAKKILEELMALYPDEGNVLIQLAEILIDLDEEDEAIEYLLDIKESDPTYLQAQLLLADLYQMQALDEVAEQKLLTASKKAPDEVIISYGLGDFYLGRGDYQKSIPHLKRAVHKKEELPGMHIELKLAEAYSAGGQFEEALQYYKEGLKDYFEPHALFGYGFTAYQVGDMVLAIEQLEALKALDPDFTSLYPYLAKAFEAEQRIDEAMDALKAGMTVDDYNDQLYLLAGKLSFKRQNPEEAVQLLQQAIAINPSNLEAIQTLAAFYKDQELFEELLDLLNHVEGLGEGGDPLLTWYEANALNHDEQFERAALKYQEVREYFKEDPDFLEEYAYFLLENGEREKAIVYFRNLLQYAPSREDVRELLLNLEN